MGLMNKQEYIQACLLRSRSIETTQAWWNNSPQSANERTTMAMLKDIVYELEYFQ